MPQKRFMTITLDLKPDIERGLLERAQLRGLSPDEYIQEMVTRESVLPSVVQVSGKEKARAFVDWAKDHPDTPPLSDEAISRANLNPDRW